MSSELTFSPPSQKFSSVFPRINIPKKAIIDTDIVYLVQILNFSNNSFLSCVFEIPAAIGPDIVGSAWKKGVIELKIKIGIATKLTNSNDKKNPISVVLNWRSNIPLSVTIKAAPDIERITFK